MSTAPEAPPIERLEVDAATVGNMLVALGAAKHALGFKPEVSLELAKPLDWDRVKKKPGRGSFDYLPHADVRRTANALFGYDGWGYTTDDVQIVAQGPMKTDKGEGVQACALARVTLKIRLMDGSWLEKGGTGEGTGNGYGPTAAVEAPGKAAKEAESDALKRAFINLGDQFGLILYAKDEERAALQAEAQAEQQEHDREQRIAEMRATDEEVEEVKAMAARVGGDVVTKTDEAIKAHRAKNETERGLGPIVDREWLKKLAAGVATQAGEKARETGEAQTTTGLKVPDGVSATVVTDGTAASDEAVAQAFGA